MGPVGLGQTDHYFLIVGKERVKNEFRSIELRVRSDWVRLTRIFHMIFFKKKTTYICHLKSHATNYLM